MRGPIQFAAAGRPGILVPGPDGQPTRCSVIVRQSTSAPSRLKVHLAAPFLHPETGQPRAVVFANIRLELN